jgi:flagellar biogenesis protein FliO
MEPVRQLLAVGAAVGALTAALWWMRRKGWARLGARSGSGRNLHAVERVALGPQCSLHLVRVANRALVVGSSPAGCVLLESFEWASLESPRAVVEREARR